MGECYLCLMLCLATWAIASSFKLVIYVIFMLLISFRIYFGSKPFLFITDLNMIKEITVKQFDKFVDRTVSTFLFMRPSILHQTASS